MSAIVTSLQEREVALLAERARIDEKLLAVRSALAGALAVSREDRPSPTTEEPCPT